MKTTDRIVDEVLVRVDKKQEKKKRYLLKRNGVCVVTAVMCFVMSLFQLSAIKMPVTVEPELTFGTIIYMNDRMGAYATIGICAFVLGVILVIVYEKITSSLGGE